MHTHSSTAAASNPRQRETARRRVAYAQIDAAYRAKQINESARELAKWYIRCCCGVWNYHQLTQAEQAARYGVARRTIVTLVQQLVDVGVIWLERHGSANRTYITAYQARLPDDDDPEPVAEISEPTYDDLRASVDAALAQGDTARAAQLTYQSAMLLARAANAGDTFFSPQTGEARCTDHVQAGSPSPVVKESEGALSTFAAPVCDEGGGGTDPSATETNNDAEVEHHEPEIVHALRAFGVGAATTLRASSAAPAKAKNTLDACRAAGGGPGLYHTMFYGGIWPRQRCGKRVDKSPLPPLDDEDAWRERYTNGPLAPYIIGGEPPPPADAEPLPDPELDTYCRDAEHALIHGWVPVAPRPTPSAAPRDDPELDKYRRSVSVPPWLWEGGDG